MTEQAEELEVEVENTEEAQLESPAENDIEETEEQRQSKSQNAKQRLRRKLRESEEEKQRLREEFNEKISALEQKVDSVINPPAARPERVNFDTEEDYEDALYEWRTPKAATNEMPEQKPAPTEKKDLLPPEVRKNWNKQFDAGVDKYDDFEEKVYSIPNEAMTDTMTFAITESETGGEVAYFLGKNPSEAARISKLSMASQVREIDKLTNKFKKSTSSAPDPIAPTKGNESGIKDISKMSPDEYKEHRRKQMAARD